MKKNLSQFKGSRYKKLTDFAQRTKDSSESKRDCNTKMGKLYVLASELAHKKSPNSEFREIVPGVIYVVDLLISLMCNHLEQVGEIMEDISKTLADRRLLNHLLAPEGKKMPLEVGIKETNILLYANLLEKYPDNMKFQSLCRHYSKILEIGRELIDRLETFT